MAIDVLLGLQWGDEGKGKIVDTLTSSYAAVCRFQGGPNAGHTLYIGGKKVVLHTIPSGIFHPDILNVIGNGVVIDPVTLLKEIETLKTFSESNIDSLRISHKAHLILPTHRWLDAASELSKGKAKIGSTLRGIGPTYMDKTGRNGLRFGDILRPGFQQKYEQLKSKHLRLLDLYKDIPEFDIQTEENKWMESIESLKHIEAIDCAHFVYREIQKGKRLLAEGAQGSMLDIDFGTYPYVTSSNTVTAGVCTGLGVAPKYIDQVIGITKAYCTRVGSGPFPTELFDETGEKLMKAGHEFGATTGRPRRCGWLDLVQLKYSCMINGVDRLVITKADVLSGFDPIKICTSYQYEGKKTSDLPYDLESDNLIPNYTELQGWHSDLTSFSNQNNQGSRWQDVPKELKDYKDFVENYMKIPVTEISVGPNREQILSVS